jgi:segregation and condensation protein A
VDLTVTERAAEREGFLLVEIDRFQGPLDLLLHLIRTQDIDVFDIPISRITDQFLKAIKGLDPHDLDGAGEFLEMAATLIRIKAQMLFPRHDAEEDDDPRADLVRRLLEYEHFRDVARVLEQSERRRVHYHAKGFVPAMPRPSLSEAPLETIWIDVWEAALGLAARLAVPEPHYRIAGPVVRMEEKIEYILRMLSDRKRVEFSLLVAPWGTRMHAVMSLLACLELARRSTLKLRQSGPFTPLWVYRGGATDAA